MSIRAAILCPGKSLARARPDWNHDMVIAVTDAIFMDAPITHWSFCEGPKHKFQWRYRRWGERVHELNPMLWVFRGTERRWVNHWDIPEERVRAIHIDEDRKLLPWGGDEWVGDNHSLGNSVFTAFLGAMIHGATTIDIWGRDLDGPNNYDPRSGAIVPTIDVNGAKTADDLPIDRWDGRWEYERELWARVLIPAISNGITIRGIPEVEHHLGGA